jgi:hypothetical protein
MEFTSFILRSPFPSSFETQAALALRMKEKGVSKDRFQNEQR